MIPPGLAGLAENPDAHTIPPPGFHRVLTERFVLLLGPTPHFTSVQRLRLDPDGVEAAVEEVRGIVREHDHTNAHWWIGGSTQPPDLAARVEALGFRPPPGRVSDLVALATASAPEPGPPEVEARPVQTLAEFTTANEIRWDAFSVPDQRREAERRQLEQQFEHVHGSGISPTFLAWVDGRPAATAIGVYAPEGCLLVGGATTEWARGRGAYRALVNARS